MLIFTVDALADKRWDELLLRHPRASVFHTRGWLEALRRTYAYRPVVLTSSASGEQLRNGVVFCEVSSRITGKRVVSLPFSDHCDLLCDSADEESEILARIWENAKYEGYSYAEIRPRWRSDYATNWQPSARFRLHILPLEAPIDKLFSALHKDCIQRKVRRAEKEHLTYEVGQTKELLHKFYGLLLQTRRRHCLMPQPYSWFHNLAESMGNSLAIRVASKDHQPVAAILTLSHKVTITYKYGCSDERFHHLGGMPFLFWKTIQEAKAEGMHQLDLGRSDFDNEGLIKFKDRLGAQSTVLTYWRHSRGRAVNFSYPAWLTQTVKQVFPCLPNALLAASGRLLYRHIG